jgi:hypothetical protein
VEKSEACSYAYAKGELEYGYYDEAMRLFTHWEAMKMRRITQSKRQPSFPKTKEQGTSSICGWLSDEQLLERARLLAAREALPNSIVSTGYKHTVARTESGTVLATGSNNPPM